MSIHNLQGHRHTQSLVAFITLFMVWAGCVTGANAQTSLNPASPAKGSSEKQKQGEADLASPRATMGWFTKEARRAEGGEEDAWADAAKALDLSKVDQARGPALSRMLYEVLEKLGGGSQANLPNARQAAALGLESYRYFPKPDDAWVGQQLKQSPPTKIILAMDRDGKWRFSSQTVVGLDALKAYLADLQPRVFPRLADNVIDFLGPTFSQTPLWAWLALLGCIFLGLVLGRITQAILRKIARRGQNKNHLMRAAAVEDAASPVSLAFLTLGIAVGLRFIHLDPQVNAFTWKIIAFLFILAAGWFVYNLVDLVELAVKQITDKDESKVSDMAVPLVRKTLRVFVVVVFALAVAQNVFGLNIAGWLAGIGVAGIAISLAAQDSLKNLFGSLTVLFDKPFVVGDFIVFMDEMGTVEQIGFRSSRLRMLSGALVTVPNMHFIDNKVQNITARPYIRREMNITITYDTPAENIEQAVDILHDILHNDEEVSGEGRFDFDNFPPRVAFNEFNDMSLNIRAYYWYQLAGEANRGFYTWLNHCQTVNLKLFRRYEQAGIDFAFPTQTLYLSNDPKRQLHVNTTTANAS